MSEAKPEAIGPSPDRPLPWKAVHSPGDDTWDVTNDAGDPREEYSVLMYTTESEAKFIVRACNAHADLITALELARSLGSQGTTDDGTSISNLIDLALAKARGQS